jgi:hypothetical protein
MVGKAQKSRGTRSELKSVFGLEKVNGHIIQGRYFKKRGRRRTFTKFRLGVIRAVIAQSV